MRQLWGVVKLTNLCQLGWDQVTLGVSTLLAYVPVSLGSAHQAGALTLFTIVLTLAHNLRRQPRAALAVVAHSSKQFGIPLA